MKKWFVLSLALVAAAVSHAVTVSWVVSNSSYNNINSWAYTTNQQGVTTLTFNIYFVYSANEMTVEGAYGLATKGPSSSIDKETGKTVTMVTYGNVMDDPAYTGGNVLAYANGLPPEPTTNNEVTNTVIGSGYYYMVIVKKNDDTNPYAVAGTTTEVIFSKSGVEMAEGEGGVYASNVGLEPKPEDYVDMGWLGGTWTQALVPEPTVLALLAMGVAGVALRRKQNFLK